jgi:hypothetical protein
MLKNFYDGTFDSCVFILVLTNDISELLSNLARKALINVVYLQNK